MITLDCKKKEVSEIQKYLSFLGYDLVIDGYFGNITLRSLKAFQKKYNLDVTGIADSFTLSALKAAQKRTSKEENYTNRIINYKNLDVDLSVNQASEQYIKQKTKKDKIFIHHNVGGPNPKYVSNFWDNISPRSASPFLIEGRGDSDGRIYEVFNPYFWSFHLGVKGSKGKLDKSSIGIELCSWGALKKRGDNFYNIYGDKISSDEVIKLEKPWRGNYYYHSYSDKQLESLEKLIEHICVEYKIEIQDFCFDNKWLEFDKSIITSNKPGIWSHSSVRKDVSELYPDQRIFSILNKIKLKMQNND